MLVVDASVAVKWFVDEPGTAEALELFTESTRFIAPELVIAEVANVLWRHLARGELETPQVAHIPEALPRVFAELRPLAPLSSRALKIGTDLGHPVYDCFYLALAEAERTSMITADRRLVGKIRGTRWERGCVSLQ